MNTTARHVSEMNGKDCDHGLAELTRVGVLHNRASFWPERMRKFPPVLSACIPKCHLHYNSVTIFGVEPTILTSGMVKRTVVSFCNLRGSLGFSRQRGLYNKLYTSLQTILLCI